MKTILDIRHQCASERTLFQDSVAALANELNDMHVQDPAALENHLEVAYQKRIRPALDDVRKKLRAAHLDTKETAMNTMLAGAGLSQLLLHFGVSKPLGIAGSFAYIGTEIKRQQRRSREQQPHVPAAYLMTVEEALRPATQVVQIGRLLTRRNRKA
jgi:Family of unknown function (DUF6236)